jgi:acyl-CoA synthetase (AMP-forming)/AMP-acid ligase II
VVLMAKFDVERYLALAERHRATHTMLVPVQYQRLLAHLRSTATTCRAFAPSSAPARRLLRR